MALRWTAADMLEAEQQFRKIIGYRDRATLVIGLQGRGGARCRRYRRSVSPTRPPNRTCPFLCIRLSTGRALAALEHWSGNGGLRPGGGPVCSGGRPRGGDAVAAI